MSNVRMNECEEAYQRGYADAKAKFEPKQGKWEDWTDENGIEIGYICNNCKTKHFVDTNFCSNCGAKMNEHA